MELPSRPELPRGLSSTGGARRAPRVFTHSLSLLVAALLVAPGARAQDESSSPGAGGLPEAPLIRVYESTYERLEFDRPLARTAVGDSSIIELELIGDREALVLGKSVGRTNLLFWYDGGAVETVHVSVERDLSVLRDALEDIDPRIRVDVAPDRDAIVLRGTVADIAAQRAAESAANQYLAARSTRGPRGRDGEGTLVLAGESTETSTTAGEGVETRTRVTVTESYDAVGATDGRVRAPAAIGGSGEVISLLRVESLPDRADQKIRDAIRSIGGEDVRVRRVRRGDLPDDASDVFVLDGRVPSQIALVRILTVASTVLSGRGSARGADIRVIAEEGGALFDELGQGGGAQNIGGAGGSGGGGAGGVIPGLGRARLGQSLIDANVGRAQALEAAGGRLLSFVEVADLPQVRLDVRFYEVDRTALLDWGADIGTIASDFDPAALNPSPFAAAFQPAPSSVGAGGGTEIQNVLTSLGGRLGEEFQIASDNFAVDAAFTWLERQGLARRLSAPSLTVLSGEVATIQVGGEIPIAESFSPALGGGTTPGVFNTVRFRGFGIQLLMRPRVGSRDDITVDLSPTVSQPDAALTESLRDATGGAVATAAFETRSIQTSSRVRDGQALVVGGLSSRGESRDRSATPLLGRIPVLGWLFSSFDRSSDDLELIVVVSPAIVREPIPDLALWAFASRDELLASDARKRAGDARAREDAKDAEADRDP